MLYVAIMLQYIYITVRERRATPTKESNDNSRDRVGKKTTFDEFNFSNVDGSDGGLAVAHTGERP